MKIIVEEDSNGKWVDCYRVGDPENQVRIGGGAQDDPAKLKKDTAVTISNATDLSNPRTVIPTLTLRADAIMTKSDIVGYTIDKNDRTPQGSTAQKKQSIFSKNMLSMSIRNVLSSSTKKPVFSSGQLSVQLI